MTARNERFGAAARALLLVLAVVGWPRLPLAAQEPGTPRLRLEPDRVRSEETVTARGAGFCGEPACPPVTIRLQGVVVVEGVAPRPDGGFEALFTAEAGPGDYVVTASQALATPGLEKQEAGRIEASAELVIELGPRLFLEPRAVRGGEPVTVTGAGFSGPYAVDAVTVRLGEEIVVDELKVREDGSLEARIVAGVALGLHRVSVTWTTAEGEPVEVGTDLIVAVGEQTPGPREPQEPSPIQ